MIHIMSGISGEPGCCESGDRLVKKLMGNQMRFAAVALVPALMAGPAEVSRAMTDGEVQRLVTQEIKALLPANGAGGAATAVRIEGRTVFFNYGFADLVDKQPITSDSLFNLASIRKAFEVTLLAQAVTQGELEFDDPVAKYVVELQQGGYIRRVTLGQLATHTSGLLLRTDYPPWPECCYTLPDFIRALNAWTPDRGEEPGKQHIYTHAGFVLLQLALERRFGTPIGDLIYRRVLKPLGMTSTTVPERGANGRGELTPALMRRAVQGYSEDGDPIGGPGDQQGYYAFPGTGQMFSSARDLAVFLAANLGELPVDPVLQEAMQLTQQGVFRISARNTQALAWEVNDFGGPLIVDKPGGLNNSSTYIGTVPSKKLGIVILANRGNQHPYEIARRMILPALAR
jgi:beta-lactamase class C